MASGRYTVHPIDENTFAIEEKTRLNQGLCYLLCGGEKALLIDTCFGYRGFAETVKSLTGLPVVVANTHAHLDHIGGNHFFDELWYHEADKDIFPEMFVPGLDEAMAAFAKQKGLIDHMYFYNLPPGFHGLRDGIPAIMDALKALPEGQYFFVTHPALDTEEMRQTGNAQTSGEDIANGRAFEAQVFSDPAVCAMLRGLGCESVRYDEAAPQARATVETFRNMFANQ